VSSARNCVSKIWQSAAGRIVTGSTLDIDIDIDAGKR